MGACEDADQLAHDGQQSHLCSLAARGQVVMAGLRVRVRANRGGDGHVQDVAGRARPLRLRRPP